MRLGKYCHKGNLILCISYKFIHLLIKLESCFLGLKKSILGPRVVFAVYGSKFRVGVNQKFMHFCLQYCGCALRNSKAPT